MSCTAGTQSNREIRRFSYFHTLSTPPTSIPSSTDTMQFVLFRATFGCMYLWACRVSKAGGGVRGEKGKGGEGCAGGGRTGWGGGISPFMLALLVLLLLRIQECWFFLLLCLQVFCRGFCLPTFLSLLQPTYPLYLLQYRQLSPTPKYPSPDPSLPTTSAPLCAHDTKTRSNTNGNRA